jgi:hypothetical protein
MTIPTVARYEVYDAIDSERDYQESRWSGSASGPDPRAHELDAWVAYIAAYTARLLDKSAGWDTPEEKIEVLNFVRKVAALCVVAMEYHGAPRREGF